MLSVHQQPFPEESAKEDAQGECEPLPTRGDIPRSEEDTQITARTEDRLHHAIT
jgi:hypothetical protein